MNLSILQGRLSMPILGYQETPEDWQREFNLIGDLGINHIEWVVTNKQYFNNPIFSDDLSGYPISIVCADNAVDERIFEKGYFFDTIFPLCEMCQENGLTTVGIPLLEKSSVNSKNKKDSIIQNLKDMKTMMLWNEKHGIKVMRMSSILFPHISNPKIQKYTILEKKKW